jgi:cytidylate kinase
MSDQLEIVTIDGPSGVGKSTISREIAARLGFTYLDTGAMYRAVALYFLEQGIDHDDPQAAEGGVSGLFIELLPPEKVGDDVRVLLGGQEVSDRLRTPEMSMLASRASALQPVRRELTRMQQEMGQAGKIVAEGRDTGTVVFPGAAWKFFLDASPEERCRRRVAQLQERGEVVDPEQVLTQIIERDRNDRERSIAPLITAKDAIVIDTTKLSIAEVVTTMLATIGEKLLSP